jgi:hypothetical protein
MLKDPAKLQLIKDIREALKLPAEGSLTSVQKRDISYWARTVKLAKGRRVSLVDSKNASEFLAMNSDYTPEYLSNLSMSEGDSLEIARRRRKSTSTKAMQTTQTNSLGAPKAPVTFANMGTTVVTKFLAEYDQSVGSTQRGGSNPSIIQCRHCFDTRDDGGGDWIVGREEIERQINEKGVTINKNKPQTPSYVPNHCRRPTVGVQPLAQRLNRWGSTSE